MEGSLPFGEAELMETELSCSQVYRDRARSLPFGEAELIETCRAWSSRAMRNRVASLRGSGINGNFFEANNDTYFFEPSLPFGEAELMETSPKVLVTFFLYLSLPFGEAELMETSGAAAISPASLCESPPRMEAELM